MYNTKSSIWSRTFRTWISFLHFALLIYKTDFALAIFFWLKMCCCHSKMCTYLDNNILSKLPSPKVWRKLRHENFKKYKQKGYHYLTHLKTFCSFLKPSLILSVPLQYSASNKNSVWWSKLRFWQSELY